MTINRKTLDQFYALAPGDRITCLENTYNALYPRDTLTVDLVQKSQLRLRTPTGGIYWIHKPAKVSDVVSMTDDTISYDFTGSNGSRGQATYRFERQP
jgi:hypothetical protein